MTQNYANNSLYRSVYERPLRVPSVNNLQRSNFLTDNDWRNRNYPAALLSQWSPLSGSAIGDLTTLVTNGTEVLQYFFPVVGVHSQELIDESAERLRSLYNCSFDKIARLLKYRGESGARMAVNRYRARTYGLANGYSYQLGSGVVQKTNTGTRRFGVEIEFKDLSFYESARVVQMVTGKHCHSTSYHGRHCDTCHSRVDYSSWKVERDSTVCETKEDEDGEEYTAGGEAISPVGYGEAHLEEISKVMRALRVAGARVNTQAGFHVHINMKDMGREGLANFVLTWAKQEDFLFGLCAPSRRNNHYCDPISLTEAQNIADQFRASGRAYGSRGALNITSYPKLGTFEIRMHQGTLNPEKMRAWVKLLLAFAQAVKQDQFGDLVPNLSMLGALTAKGFLDQEIGSYLFARHGHLAN